MRKGFVSMFTSYLAVFGSRLCDGFNPSDMMLRKARGSKYFDYDSVHR